MTTTPQAALLREAAQNALITLDGIADTNPRDKTDFEDKDEWITWAKSRARWAADALRAPIAQEIYAERILKQMLHESDPAQATQEPVHATPGPMFWVRLRSDGGYEGPIHNAVIEDVRRMSGAWHPLYLGSEPVQAGELPPLPEPAHRGPTGTGAYFNSFTADQMHAYARAALAARKPAVPLTLQQATAICICLTSQRVSVSEVQRKLRIGWNEAKDLCKTLVDSGLLGDIEISNHINGVGMEVKP